MNDPRRVLERHRYLAAWLALCVFGLLLIAVVQQVSS